MSEETYRAVLRDMANSLKSQGFTEVLQDTTTWVVSRHA
jgi:hypothetical protein